jgi:iron complex outermembrane receptor protein
MISYRALSIALALTAGSTAAAAQTASTEPAASSETDATQNDATQENDGVRDIVVVAQRRSERLQDVPIAVSVLRGDDAAERGVTSTVDLTAAVPGLVVNYNANVGNLYLRGVGSNLPNPTDEQPTATYVDGVYIPFPQSNFFTFYDVERIEVLKGPQGTLFGRNATGGVVQIITREPSRHPELSVALTYGNYDTVGVQAYGSTGIGENAAIAITAQYDNQGDGYGRNLTLNMPTFQRAIDSYSVRARLLVTPSSSTRILLTADYSNLRNSSGYQLIPGVLGGDGVSRYSGRFNTLNDLPMGNPMEMYGVSLRINQEIGNLSFTSISAYRDMTSTFFSDADGTPQRLSNLDLPEAGRAFSQEFQIAGPTGGRFQWIAGLYYFEIRGEGTLRSRNGATPVTLISSNQQGQSVAAFAQGTLDLGGGTSITAGARYTGEWQQFRFPARSVSANQSVDRPSWRLAIDHKFNDDIMIYASYNNSFKSGGFNLISPTLLAATPVVNNFEPEVLQSFEGGLKSRWFGGRLQLNIAGYYYLYDDIQTALVIPGGVVTLNAAQAHTQGLEVEFVARPTRILELSGGFSIMKSVYDSYPNAPSISAAAVQTVIDATGNELPVTPHFTATMTATLNLPLWGGTLRPSVTASYNNGFFWFADNRLRSPSYWLFNGQIGWQSADERWGARLWMRNIGDEYYYVARLSRVRFGDSQVPAAPRTFGITLTSTFR